MIAVRTTDPVELTWEQEASVAVKQAQLFSVAQQQRVVGSLCLEHAKTGSRRPS